MNKSILIIDDDEEDHFIMREALFEAGVKAGVYCATSGQLGLVLLGQLTGHLPSLILLDLNMPKMNGMEALIKIKEKYGSIPVLMHTTSCSDKVRKDAKANGAVDCVQKGTCRAELIKTAKLIEQILSKNFNAEP
jgi:CheY-like chemotaxis protein